MTTININLPDTLKAFADKQAAANQLPGAGEYIESLVAREQLELALMEGIQSGPAIEVDEAWFNRKRQQLIERSQANP